MDMNLGNSGKWWRTEKLGVLQPMGFQRLDTTGYATASNLNLATLTPFFTDEAPHDSFKLRYHLLIPCADLQEIHY